MKFCGVACDVVGGWIRALRPISAPNELIKTGRDHGNETKDDTAIQLIN